MVVNYVKIGIMDKRKLEYGGLATPIEMLIKKGNDAHSTPEQISAQIVQALSGKMASYSSGEVISVLTAPARMLITLIDEPFMTQRALSIYLGISEAAVQKTIKTLIESGLVAKTKLAGRNSYAVDLEKFYELSDIIHLRRALGICQEAVEPF